MKTLPTTCLLALLPALQNAAAPGPAVPAGTEIDDWTRGVDAYAAQRYADALAAFTRAAATEEGRAPAPLLVNRALAALGHRRHRIAEAAAEKAAVRGGPALYPVRDFLLGCAAYGRGELAAAEAQLLDAEPTAFDRGLEQFARALAHWQRAAMSREDWPEARRNAERAQRQLAELERLRAEAEEKKKKKQAKKKKKADDRGEREEVEIEAKQQTPTPAMSDADLASVFAKLAAKEREKREIRRARQRSAAFRAERDW